ncbi:helix-turn-helix domain-containing GNAT family N-acetyltransferase [Ferrovibrio sp.]|uniref:bifunctional helix-turn-helix transcriptional regulator/GNAT family N-acetyltransferase n=1 Tax=Ferrovibrio sp. TaxID=1917215 RepID=UPI001B3F864C|nr:helix-turn-helix domain-containing GNAT family N-acetyltransferase [Ferrovibrio sp.]MBP7064006.1 MarR family transcriptional regulator [Ferrovibrio sp.]
MTNAAFDQDVAALRRFNRLYTQRIGVLKPGLHDSRFSLTEARLLYELANRDGLSAGQLCQELGLDAGYVSRMLRGFERDGLLKRRADASDKRRSLLTLTAAGRKAYAPLDAASRNEIGALLKPLGEAGRERLMQAVHGMENLLRLDPAAAATAISLRPHRPGDIGWVISRHGAVYAEEFGWDISFEALVAEIGAGFLKNFDPEREAGWIAEKDGERVGSVFVVQQSRTVAKLRLLLVEPAARGHGLGHRLVATCEAFAREKGYRKMVLWTNANLLDARRIYQRGGYSLVKSEPHHSFGHDLIGEYWEKKL